MQTRLFSAFALLLGLVPGPPAARAQRLPQRLPQQLDAVATAYATAGQLSGTVLVAAQGKVVFTKGYGLANREWNQPNAADTRFRLGSLTKQFTALLVLQLVEQGKLKLDGHLSDYLPDYPSPSGTKITIHHLLTHTAGLPNFTDRPDFPAVGLLPTTPAAFVRTFAGLPLDFEPGSQFRYSNSGYFVLGALIEKVTGKPYAQVLAENILQPLGMHDTGYDLPGTVLPHRAAGYEKTGGIVRNAAYLDMTVPYAAGALYSTVLDLYKWDQALYTTQLLSEASKVLLFKPFKQGYAYGWGVGQVVAGPDTLAVLGHNGGINGFGTTISRVPKSRDLVVVLDNEGGAQVGPLGADLLRVLHGQAARGPAAPGAAPAPAGPAARVAPAEAEAAATLAGYVGRYQFSPAFAVTVRAEGGQLWAQATGQQPFALQPQAPGRYRVQGVAAEVEFVRNAAGVVDQLVLHQNGHSSPGRKVE